MSDAFKEYAKPKETPGGSNTDCLFVLVPDIHVNSQERNVMTQRMGMPLPTNASSLRQMKMSPDVPTLLAIQQLL